MLIKGCIIESFKASKCPIIFWALSLKLLFIVFKDLHDRFCVHEWIKDKKAKKWSWILKDELNWDARENTAAK